MAKMRFALIGAGAVADAHARSIQELDEAEALVVYSRDLAKARSFADAHGIAEATDDYQAILARDDIDAVDILTAPWVHANQAIAAMAAGKHALVEKPADVTIAACDALAQAEKDTGRTLGFVFQNRLKKSVRRVKDYLDAGGLGELLMVSVYVKWYRPPSYYTANDWRGKYATEGGGVLFGQAGHSVDLMQWFAGPAEWLFANSVTSPVHPGIEIEDLASVTLRFANGAVGTIEASTALSPGSAERMEIHGSRGTIALEAGNIVDWRITDPGPDDEPGDVAEETGTGASDPMAFPITWHTRQIADFIAAAAEGRKTCMPIEEARKLNELYEYMKLSAQRREAVQVEP